MSDQWDFYFANVNDKLASLFLDVGIRDRVPDPSRPWLLWVWVTLLRMRSPRLSLRASMGFLSGALRPMDDVNFIHTQLNWSQYLDVLYPTPRDWQRIQNRHVIEHLQSLGDRLQKKRLVSHWAYFPDEATRGRFVASIEDLGFSILQQQVDSDSQAANPMSVSFERVDDVDWDSINQVTLELFELADSCSGQYDGWETSVEKDD